MLQLLSMKKKGKVTITARITRNSYDVLRDISRSYGVPINVIINSLISLEIKESKDYQSLLERIRKGIKGIEVK